LCKFAEDVEIILMIVGDVAANEVGVERCKEWKLLDAQISLQLSKRAL